jgi:hypothetical protein
MSQNAQVRAELPAMMGGMRYTSYQYPRPTANDIEESDVFFEPRVRHYVQLFQPP